MPSEISGDRAIGRHTFRVARPDDATGIERLMTESIRGLLPEFYTPAQLEAARGRVFAVDRQLLEDGTYFVSECDGKLSAAGGWSQRHASFGDGSLVGSATTSKLDPRRDPARIRAFFVHPEFARRGLGRQLLAACETALRSAGFSRVEIVATLAGERLYRAGGYVVVEHFAIPLSAGTSLPVVRMVKSWA